jgi:hypothetical protein
MNVLQIVETAYRATAEEQDDAVLWFTQVLLGGGAKLALLLQGSAVSYAVAAQDASGLSFGTWRQTQPPTVAATLAALLGSGVPIYAVDEDLADRGIREEACVAGIRRIPRSQCAELFERFDRVWHW